MKLEPIFVVAPDPTLPSMSSRRAFMGMGVAFALGGVVGSACGYSVGLAAAKGDATDPVDELQSTGDLDLDEFRRLAIKAPIEELMARAYQFLVVRERSYRQDKVLWKGVVRMCDEVIANAAIQDRRRLAKALIATVERGEPPPELELLARVEGLRRLQ